MRFGEKFLCELPLFSPCPPCLRGEMTFLQWSHGCWVAGGRPRGAKRLKRPSSLGQRRNEKGRLFSRQRIHGQLAECKLAEGTDGRVIIGQNRTFFPITPLSIHTHAIYRARTSHAGHRPGTPRHLWLTESSGRLYSSTASAAWARPGGGPDRSPPACPIGMIDFSQPSTPSPPPDYRIFVQAAACRCLARACFRRLTLRV